MDLPEGRLVRSRVITDPGEALRSALERDLTGYAVLEPGNALLLDADDAGVIAFEGGIPVAAAHVGTGRGGPPALADLAVAGPYSVELRALDREAVVPVGADPDLRVPPGIPAERLAGDPDLADRTRRRAPGDSGSNAGHGTEAEERSTGPNAVAAFLEDEAKIEALREQAREQARHRADEWGLSDQLE